MNKIYCSDALEFTKSLSDESVDCVITSPPYFQLRDYGWTGQWGLEETYQEYLYKMVALMSELKRALKPTGTMWINLGDSYGTVSGAMRDGKFGKKNTNNQQFTQTEFVHKCLMLIPHRFAIRCIDELGLILRNDIIWAKRNGMPESVTDRFSKKHEFFFFFVKQQKYYFDLDGVRDDHKEISKKRYAQNIDQQTGSYRVPNKSNGTMKAVYKQGYAEASGGQSNSYGGVGFNGMGKNPGDVSDFWDIATKPSSSKHYAVFNFKLIDKPIVSGCPEGGIIFDPFCGTGTTLARAIQLNRKAIGCDGSEDYCNIAQKRIDNILSQEVLSL